MYVLEGGFREARRYRLCMLAAFSVFTKYARRWRTRSGAVRPDPPKAT
jgi:hypothetical protein